MSPLPILILLLAAADIAFSKEAPSKIAEGAKYVHRAKLFDNIDDDISCAVRTNTIVNATVMQSVYRYKLNGEPKVEESYLTLRTLTDTQSCQFIYSVEYKDINDPDSEVCSYVVEVRKNNNLIVYFLGKDSKIDTVCASSSKTASEELEKICPESEGFFTVDQTNC